MSRIDSLSRAFLKSFKPPPKLSLSEWADRHAVLSSESSAEAGRWHTIPYQKGIMDCFTDPKIEEVWCMKSARVGWTKILNHVIAYHIDQDPCSIMMVQPTIEDAEGYSKEEIGPMLRDTPRLQGLVSDAKEKDGKNTILNKTYPGGTLGIVGANSPRGFRRVSRRVVLFDEVDGYPPGGAGNEGDQIKLGKRRSEYFWNRKIGGGSTPTVKDISRIDRLYQNTDQRRYFVPCPQCSEMQYLKWRGVKWPEGEPEKAYYQCEANGCVISHNQKRWMIERGEWRATAPQVNGGRTVGFHIWAAYSYSPNASWGTLAAEFLEAKNDPEMLKTFVNTVLGETWEEAYSAKVGADTLQARAETYVPSVAPKGALCLTAGVDVQDNRLEYTVYGWGRGEEAWVVEHSAIFGDPAQPEVWKQLDEVLLREYRNTDAAKMKILAAAIDSGGHFTSEVYAYTRERKSKRIIAVKGASQRAKPAISKPTKQDINFRGQVLKSGVDLYSVGTDTIKGTMYARMKLTEGVGRMHFHAGLPPEFFAQITAEKQVTRYTKGGVAVREWIKKNGARNEALDCMVYAYAALQFLYTKFSRHTFWDQLEKIIGRQGIEMKKEEEKKEEPKVEEKPEETTQEVTNVPENPPVKTENPLIKAARTRTINRNRRGRGFVSNW